ncbi:RidA family protein [Chryseobacterium sp. Mn2064]|uniref:RidA family protein n=1 Tax=Chryseobacterium sp. Mn2064 TaxID=3395263 RepID=UPI003BE1CCD5
MKSIFNLSALLLGFLALSQNTNSVLHKNPKTIFDPTPFAFSHSATVIETKGKYVFISGQSGGEGLHHVLSNDFRTQVKTSLQNLKTILAEYDLEAKDILKITILIVDHNQEKLKIWTEEASKIWKNDQFPASTLIPVPKLALDNMLIEVDAVAFMKDKQRI